MPTLIEQLDEIFERADAQTNLAGYLRDLRSEGREGDVEIDFDNPDAIRELLTYFVSQLKASREASYAIASSVNGETDGSVA